MFFAFSLASALCCRASSVAPVRGGTYFSLPPQRKVGAVSNVKRNTMPSEQNYQVEKQVQAWWR
ncbi:hypothetical protein, partial [Paraburkholderia azotifigens]|uniref:hypothetical protein n=1 Tax=Paraburkholderia azotifigens TaxID=2057004 RepID=UPI0038B77257